MTTQEKPSRALVIKKVVKTFLLIAAVVIFFIGIISLQIYMYADSTSEVRADAAIVLGAAVWGEKLSPVFKERVNHALNLYRDGKVQKVIFTGGQGNRDELTEAAMARQYAIENGIPEKDILVEEKSQNTYENILNAKQVAETHQLKRVLIVSDPIHMKRAMMMAGDLGLEAFPSPTPTTKYQSVKSRLDLLAHETYYYTGYLIQRLLK